jgi:hypothetical protein
MSHELPPPVLPHAAAATPSDTPAPDLSAAEANMPLPSSEQARLADKVFTTPPEAHAALTIAGVWTGALILHDVMVDTFSTSEEDEEELGDPDGKKEGPAPGEE